jgi:hypothetical protein
MGLQGSKAATAPQADPGAGELLVTEASRSGGSEPTAPIEGAAAAAAGTIDDATAWNQWYVVLF